MKSNEKKTSLAILSILAGVVYFITLIPYFEAGWEGGIRNVKETNQVQLNDQNEIVEISKIPQHIQLTSKNYDIIYSDSIMNIKNGHYIPLNYTRVEASDVSDSNIWVDGMMSFIAFMGFIVFIIIPFYYYKLIISFYNDQLFTFKNLKRIKILAVLYSILYALKVGYILRNYYKVKSNVAFENYNIEKPDLASNFLLIAILLLIIAIVMKRIMIMKEEQDLII